MIISAELKKNQRLVPTNQLQQLIRRNFSTHIRNFQQTIRQIAFLMVVIKI